jgi:hypothetical protein
MEIDRKAFFASLGGAAVAGLMSAEAKADALEDFLSQQLDEQVARNRDGGEAAKTFFPPPPPGKEFPTAAEIDAQIETRNYRRGAGGLFANANQVKRLPPMPARPTIVDYFHLRFNQFNNHVLQSATLARKNGMTDEIVLACLLHDVVQCMMKTDHGWWGAQLFEPYVPEKTSFAIRHHQTLRYFEDPANGYHVPDLYRAMFGYDYEPPPHILANYQFIRKHKWYILPRQVTLNDLYAFDANAVVTLDPYIDLLGKYFKTPKEGLGNDNSPVAHMWRTIAMPDTAL